MTLLKRLFDFYLEASLHVALAAWAFVCVTEILLGLLPDYPLQGFVFCGTVVGYNFVKYDALARSGSSMRSPRMKGFIAVSVVAFFIGFYCFLQLTRTVQVVALVCAAITALYTLPFFPNRRNARSWSGLKIYIVAACWVGATALLPVLEAGMALDRDVVIVCVKRFLLVVVELFIFEIIDLSWDDPHLKTVPQQIGVNNTKRLGVALLVVFLLLELSQAGEDAVRFAAGSLMVIVTGLFLWLSREDRSRYYTTFWVEAVPVFWLLLLWFLD